MPLDLKKSAPEAKKQAGLSLIKKARDQGMERAELRSQVVAAFDVSGSMRDFFRDGIVKALATRGLGVAMVVDDDGKLPIYAFDQGVHRLPEVLTEANLDIYVDRYVRPLVGGRTNYAPVLEAIFADLQPGDPVFVLFFTDGDNDDHGLAKTIIRRMSNNPIFIQTVGIYDSRKNPPEFTFLNELNTLSGRTIDNAGFCTVDLNTVTDEQLYDALMNEYPSFIKAARKMGMLPWTQKK